jgi:hypothetical protein
MQLHFSVDPATGERLAREARKRGMTLSSYLASLVEESSPAAWPRGYLERVAGSCASTGLREPPDAVPDPVERLGP